MSLFRKTKMKALYAATMEFEACKSWRPMDVGVEFQVGPIQVARDGMDQAVMAFGSGDPALPLYDARTLEPLGFVPTSWRLFEDMRRNMNRRIGRPDLRPTRGFEFKEVTPATYSRLGDLEELGRAGWALGALNSTGAVWLQRRIPPEERRLSERRLSERRDCPPTEELNS